MPQIAPHATCWPLMMRPRSRERRFLSVASSATPKQGATRDHLHGLLSGYSQLLFRVLAYPAAGRTHCMYGTHRSKFTFVHAHVATELWLQIVVGGGRPAHAVMEDVIVRSRAAHGIISSYGSPRVQRLSARWNATVPVAFGEVEYDIDLTWRGGVHTSQ